MLKPKEVASLLNVNQFMRLCQAVDQIGQKADVKFDVLNIFCDEKHNFDVVVKTEAEQILFLKVAA